MGWRVQAVISSWEGPFKCGTNFVQPRALNQVNLGCYGFFDQIQFYPVEAEELLNIREDFLRGRFEADITETTFDLGDYLQFLDEIEDSTEVFRHQQQTAFQEERSRWKELGLAEYISEPGDEKAAEEDNLPEGATAVRSSMPGSIWKVLVSPGQYVEKGDILIIEESMKMEFPQTAPCEGYISSIYVKPGDGVHAGQLIVSIVKECVSAEEQETVIVVH
jgi:urea carboxylase